MVKKERIVREGLDFPDGSVLEKFDEYLYSYDNGGIALTISEELDDIVKRQKKVSNSRSVSDDTDDRNNIGLFGETALRILLPNAMWTGPESQEYDFFFQMLKDPEDETSELVDIYLDVKTKWQKQDFPPALNYMGGVFEYQIENLKKNKRNGITVANMLSFCRVSGPKSDEPYQTVYLMGNMSVIKFLKEAHFYKKGDYEGNHKIVKPCYQVPYECLSRNWDKLIKEHR